MKRHKLNGLISNLDGKTEVPSGHIVNQGDFEKTPEKPVTTELPQGHIALVGDIEKPTPDQAQ